MAVSNSVFSSNITVCNYCLFQGKGESFNQLKLGFSMEFNEYLLGIKQQYNQRFKNLYIEQEASKRISGVMFCS